MTVEVYRERRSNRAILYSDEFSVDCSLPNLFMSNRYRCSQSDYLHNLFITFKPARTTFKITPYFFIESDTLNSPDFRLEDFYYHIVSVLFDILDIKFIQSNTLLDYKSTLNLANKVCTIEVSREEFKKFISSVIDKVFMSCLLYIDSKSQFKQLYIFRSWLYNYFPKIRIHYVENELMRLLKQHITRTL